MSETKHTPGPWHILQGAGGWIFTEDPYGHGNMHIADVRGWGHLTGKGACAFDSEKAVAIHDANARLIAAAPELLAAWLDYIDMWNVRHEDGRCPKDDTCECPLVARINAAIRKALGR